MRASTWRVALLPPFPVRVVRRVICTFIDRMLFCVLDLLLVLVWPAAWQLCGALILALALALAGALRAGGGFTAACQSATT